MGRIINNVMAESQFAPALKHLVREPDTNKCTPAISFLIERLAQLITTEKDLIVLFPIPVPEEILNNMFWHDTTEGVLSDKQVERFKRQHKQGYEDLATWQMTQLLLRR